VSSRLFILLYRNVMCAVILKGKAETFKKFLRLGLSDSLFAEGIGRRYNTQLRAITRPQSVICRMVSACGLARCLQPSTQRRNGSKWKLQSKVQQREREKRYIYLLSLSLSIYIYIYIYIYIHTHTHIRKGEWSFRLSHHVYRNGNHRKNF